MAFEKPGPAVHRGEALWLEAGGATGVAALLWVTEKCKQTMLGKGQLCASVEERQHGPNFSGS